MAGDFVHVGCKIPSGIILNLTRYEVLNKEHGIVQRQGEELDTVTLKGTAIKFGQPDLSLDGYVFTRVPKDFWDEWMRTHADSSLLKDGFIKAAPSESAAKSIAREHEKERGQFPRITEDDPRVRNLGLKKFDPKDDAQAA